METNDSAKEFRVFIVPVNDKGILKTPIPIVANGNTIFGRGDVFHVSDRHVSRNHAEITTSSTSKTVTLRQLSVNPTEIRRKNEPDKLIGKGSLFQLQNGDFISLSKGKILFTVLIEDEMDKEMEDSINEDATQLDFEALEEMERANKSKRKNQVEFDNDNIKKTKTHGEFHKGAFPFANSSILINPSELEFIRTIGIGSCGEVSQCAWKGTQVAVKKIFRALLHGDTLREFELESDILRRLRHPNIVLFMGTCIQQRDMCIITEYLDKGSLREVLQDVSNVLDWPILLRMSIDAARGMNYLHTYNPVIIHRDLKSHNLLVDKSFNVKVSDFGLAKFVVLEDKATTFCGTLPWTAPEVFDGNGYSESADVYSYGIVLWELITRLEPYVGLTKPQIIIGVTKEGLRPPIPSDCPAPYADLIRDCWQAVPSQRPSFSQILHRLELLYRLASGNATNNNATNHAANNNGNLMSGVATVAQGGRALNTPMHLTEQFQQFQSQAIKHSWEIDPNLIEFKEELGEGTNSMVYKGIYKGESIAIKVLKESVDGKHKEDFQKELDVMSSIKSPSVVTFFGACLHPQLAIVTEYLSNGSIFNLMQKSDQQMSESTMGKFTFDWPLVIKLITDSAIALNVLHTWNPPIVHRDVKPHNLLVDDQMNVKITDFGLARFSANNNNQTSLSKLKGTYAYAAPEAYHGQLYTTKSDVFSFGIVIWELVTRLITGSYQKPYSDHKNLKYDFQIIVQTAKNGLRPVIHSSCPPPFVELMQRCWNADPNLRPTLDQVIQHIKAIRELFEQEQSKKK